MSRSVARHCTVVAVVALIAAACGNGGDAEGALSIEDARARSTAPSAEAGAAYMDLVNDSDADVSLTSASVPANIAGLVELHETVAAESDDSDMDGMDANADADADADADSDMDEGDMDGMDADADADMDDSDMDGMGGMSMREVPAIDVPAGQTVTLEPGGLHVMLLELPGPLEADDTFELTLNFDDGTEQTVTVEVADDV